MLAPATIAACALAGLAMGTLFAQQFARAGATRPAVTQVSADDSFVEAFGDPPLESATRLRPSGFGGQAATVEEDAR